MKYLETYKSFEAIDLSKRENYKLLFQNKAIIVYRGIHESGKNFYKGDEKLPFTYYSLTKEKAEYYGKLHRYVFNKKEIPIKIFRSSNLFDKFGLDSDIENKNVINILVEEGYSGVLIKGDELVVYDDSLIQEIL